jgi:hypothetical protein
MQFLNQGTKIVATNRGGAKVLIVDAETGKVETSLPYKK